MKVARDGRLGALGRVLTMRAREGHSGPHAAHFWDAETAGGGAFLDMGCHCIEAARYIVGKDVAVTEVFAWGATLGHADKTTGEDNAIAILRFEDGRTATIEASWTAKGGIEVRNEVYCERGRIVHDLGVDADPGVPPGAGRLPRREDRRRHRLGLSRSPTSRASPGYDEQFRHFVEAFRDRHDAARDVRGRLRRQHDHRRRLPLDAQRPLGSRSRTRACRLPSEAAHDRTGRDRACPRMAVGGDGAARAPGRDPGRRHRAGQPVVRRDDRRRTASSTCSGPAIRASRSRRCSRATARIRASTRWSSCR